MAEIADIAREEARKIDLASLKNAGIERTAEGFYILGNYPPLTAMDDCSEETLLAGNTQNEFDVYLHFQFCEQLCDFCHFYMDQRPRSNDDPMVTRYLDNLKKEISLLNERIGGITARSIYVGGGTPSFMSARQIEDLFSHLYSEINVPKGTIVTFDVHPEILHSGFDEKLDTLQRMGVNRIAMGGVDLNDEVLRIQQRGHTARDIIDLIISLKLKGMPHVTVDMMLGLPGQTPESWERTLSLLIENEIDSVMSFPLMFKASQINWRQYLRNPKYFPTLSERTVMQLISIKKFLQADYEQAPIYYFNRGREHENDQQLRKFETHESGLLAMGVSSFGFVNGYQYFNTPYVTDYNKALESGTLPVWRAAKLTQRHNFERALMFGLKSRGIDKRRIEEKYGFSVDREYAPIIERLCGVGLLESTSEYLRLTRFGELFAEEVCDKFAGEDVRRKAERTAASIDPRNPIQRYNYNMIGHIVKAPNIRT